VSATPEATAPPPSEDPAPAAPGADSPPPVVQPQVFAAEMDMPTLAEGSAAEVMEQPQQEHLEGSTRRPGASEPVPEQSESSSNLASGTTRAPSGVESDSVALPSNWQKVEAEDGRVYYWDTVTNHVLWDLPSMAAGETAAGSESMDPAADEDETEPVEAESSPHRRRERSGMRRARPPASESQADALPPGWQEVKSHDGKAYYWNTVTHQVQWDRPSGGGGDAPPRPCGVADASSAEDLTA